MQFIKFKPREREREREGGRTFYEYYREVGIQIAKSSSGRGQEIEFATLRLNLHRSRITGSMLQAAPGSWCVDVTLTHKATQNGHGFEMQDKKRDSAALCAAVFHTHTHTHTHTQAASVPSFFLSVCLVPSLSASFFPTSFSLFLPLPFHSVLPGILCLYLSSLHYYIFLPLLSSFPICFSFLHFF